AEPDGAQPESQNADAPPDSGQADGGIGPSEPKRSRSRSRRSRDSAAKDSAAKDGTAQDGSGPATDGETDLPPGVRTTRGTRCSMSASRTATMTSGRSRVRPVSRPRSSAAV